MDDTTRETGRWWIARIRADLEAQSRKRSDPAGVAENAQEAVQGDDADLDQQNHPLRGVHDPGSTL